MSFNNIKNLTWINKVYSLEFNPVKPFLLTKDLLSKEILNFFNSVKVDNTFSEKHILILFRVQFSNNEIATIGNLKRINLIEAEFKQYIDYLNELINLKDDQYKNEAIKNIIFSYTLKEGKINNNIIQKTLDSNTKVKNNFLSFQIYKLPIAFYPSEYDNVIKINNYDYVVALKNNYIIKIKYFSNKIPLRTKCTLYKENKVILEYQDVKLNNNSFMRKINNNKYTFINGKLEIMEAFKKCKFINPLKNKTKNNNFKFITLDIETFLDENNYHIPFCICIYDGLETKSFYLDEFKSSEDMLLTALKSITTRNYNNYNIYAHNFSSFDGIILLQILNKIGIINPIIKDGKIISINLTYQSTGKRNYNIKFYDSYLLLQASLRKLAKSFNTEVQKGNFDPTIINKNNYILYKNEVINYCKDDTISLYQVLTKFNALIFDRYKFTIKNFSTLPSLTFGNFKKNYLKENQITQISGQIENNIRKSFTGGAVDMYIPFNNENENLIALDVNSLYPYAMKEFDFPIGEPTYFQGDITLGNKDAFGIFHCEITSPKYLEHPILQTHVKTKAGIRTIAPLGNWNDWLTSPEIENARKFGYNFKILEGYTFQKGNPFQEYISDLYALRLFYPKSDPMNYIAKLFMNAFYGRFGMKDDFNEIRIVNNETLSKLCDNIDISIKDIIKLGKSKDEFIIIINKNEKQKIISLFNNLNETHYINIPIATFVTSYSRIWMSQFKNNPLIKLFYTDTDSIFISTETIPDFLLNLIDDKDLGKLKLEHNVIKAIFLAPKLYCFLTNENKLITKTRGLSHNIELNLGDFQNLLYKNTEINKIQSKWFKNIYQGTIKIEDLPYSIKYTENKRKLIFDSNGKLIKTEPFTINSNKEIIE
jgi:hypothetical protein